LAQCFQIKLQTRWGEPELFVDGAGPTFDDPGVWIVWAATLRYIASGVKEVTTSLTARANLRRLLGVEQIATSRTCPPLFLLKHGSSVKLCVYLALFIAELE